MSRNLNPRIFCLQFNLRNRGSLLLTNYEVALDDNPRQRGTLSHQIERGVCRHTTILFTPYEVRSTYYEVWLAQCSDTSCGVLHIAKAKQETNQISVIGERRLGRGLAFQLLDRDRRQGQPELSKVFFARIARGLGGMPSGVALASGKPARWARFAAMGDGQVSLHGASYGARRRVLSLAFIKRVRCPMLLCPRIVYSSLSFVLGALQHDS